MITVNLHKAKQIAHELRRAARTAEFAPLDEVIARRIPGADDVAAEASRAAVRLKYAGLQAEVDAAADVSALTTIVDSFRTSIK